MLGGMVIVPRAFIFFVLTLLLAPAMKAQAPPAFPADPEQDLERTSFQTSKPWSPSGNLRADVAMVYGIDPTMPERVAGWRDRGYRVHLMTGVSWGDYQDYLYGRFDGVNHVDNAQTDRAGRKISHGGDVYYMCPAENYGQFLCVGIQRALDAGVEAIHLEEPEFWARAGYSEGFKREWQAYYHEDWQRPDSSPDAQWRASKLKYFLYRRALQQVFDYVQSFNQKTGKHVRCYVPTHSLINYAHWCIVSPESSLARLQGCDGYIAQVWTGTARTANHFRGVRKERTFETAFLEYGAMQNLVRATGRTVWYLNDPVEDNPRHDWTDYRSNWESTLTASLLQPEVWQFEVAPWPERIFGWKYPRNAPPDKQQPIPPEYATELQVVMQALQGMKQPDIQWTSGTRGVGILISDSLMFQREQPTPSDPSMAHFYGLALPLVKRGLPVTPVQLENVTLPGFLDEQKVLLLSYRGQKPLSADVHTALAEWVNKGGWLVMVDDDQDPYNGVREWWNEGGANQRIPRQHLFDSLGVEEKEAAERGEKGLAIGSGGLVWIRDNPVRFALSAEGDAQLTQYAKAAAEMAHLSWSESASIQLRRGPFVIAAGLDESISTEPKTIEGRFIDLFDGALPLRVNPTITPRSRLLLLDLPRAVAAAGSGDGPKLLASGGKALLKMVAAASNTFEWTVEGVGDTPAILLFYAHSAPRRVSLDGNPLDSVEFDADNQLLRIRYPNTSHPRILRLTY